ncbi:MAG: Asp23/Gls24 family envelope stress response protein, partial [Kiritimatiellae bacterium]|nr:Asp23/Gls24 family envelope stress response protein [Kiritimatiellia bacterium]
MSPEVKSLSAAKPAQPRPPTYPAPVEHNDEETNLGSIQIHSGVMAVIARTAAMGVPGVADVVGSLVGDMAGKIGIKSADRGVQVDLVDDQVTMTLSLLVDYG